MYSKDYYESSAYNPALIGMEIFQKMSQYMPFMVFITRASDFKLLYANRKVSEFLGLDLSDLHRMDGRILEMMEPDQIEKLLDIGPKIQTINDDQALKVTVRLQTKNGDTVHLETSVSIFKRSEDGSPAEFFCVSENITEKVKLEERAKELEMISHSAEETFRYGAWEWFPKDDKVVWANGIYDIFELDPDNGDLAIPQYLNMIHPEDIEQFNAVVENAVATRTSFIVEYRVISASGKISYLREQGKPILEPNGQILKFIGTIWDISDYRETLNNLNKYEATLKDAERNLKLGTWEWDIQGNRIKWSEGFWRILEYPEAFHHDDWMPLETYIKHVPPEMQEDKSKELYTELPNGFDRTEPRQITLITHTGRTVYAVSHTSILDCKDGKPVFAVGSTADITSLKNIQNSLEDKVEELSKAYEEVEQFSYVASHDLQEPLRKITAFSERLKDKYGDYLGGDGVLYLNRIIDGTARMRTLIDDLLALSRTKRNVQYFITTNLNDILAEVQADLEPKILERNASVVIAQLPVIQAIPTQMHQIFLNLLSNSLKFVQPGANTVIHINSHPITQKQKDEYRLDTQRDYVHISVQDNGIGFEPEFAESIFSPFKRLHGRSEFEGTGIGLAICKKVAQNHAGKIWATSTLGAGATFHIILAVNPTDMPKPA